MADVLTILDHGSALAVDEERECIWFAQDDGTLGSLYFDDLTAPVIHQVLTPGIVALAVNDNVLIAVHSDGSISSLDPENPSDPAFNVDTGPPNPSQTALSNRDPPTAAVVSEDELSLVRLGGGNTRTVDIKGLSGVTIADGTTYVGFNSSQRGEVAVLRGSNVFSLAAGLPKVGRVGTLYDGDILIAAHPGIGQLSFAEPASSDNTKTYSLGDVPGTLIEAQGISDGTIVILTTDAIAIVDSIDQLERAPFIDQPAPIFLGSWARLHFDLGDTSLTPTDVSFDVPEGPEAGFVSYARENGAGDPVPLLVVGGLVGDHEVQLVETATGKLLASTIFTIVDLWKDKEVGPPGFYTNNSNFAADSGWGGGPNTPQNMNTNTHTGTWRTIVLMVDTTTARWPGGAPLTQSRTDILGHITNGFAFNGTNRSVRQYFEENSNYVAPSGGNPGRGLTIGVNGGVTIGPVMMPNAWGDYFQQDVDPKTGKVLDARWTSYGTAIQSMISQSISSGLATTADYSNIDAVILVPFSPDQTNAGDRFVWPHASIGPGEWLCGLNSTTDKRQFAYAFAPLDFSVHDGRQMHSTLSHELGHTLGLPDLYRDDSYSADVNGRTTTDWDMMGGSRDLLPHYTLSNKMRMGWVPPNQLKLYNFQGSGAVSENITLQASELGNIPAGRWKGAEIRLGDGWNYYVEYRAIQAGEISDSILTDRTAVITDVTSGNFIPPYARPNTLLVRKDIDGDGPLLNTGADLKEKDPGTQMDMVVKVVSTAGDSAVVKVTYGSNGKPEPGIRPWNGAASNWQSPDIEIRNAKATADPGHYFNVPWLGHDNTIVAKVKNSGDLLATGVVVDFFITEYSAGDGPWQPLGFATNNIGAGATVEFVCPNAWKPDGNSNRHYCIIVQIRLYQDPGNPAIVDQNIFNNEARSNYTSFVSASASPSSRVGTRVLLSNPFNRESTVVADVKKTHPYHRVFTDHQWLRVPAKSARPIAVWDEAIYGTPQWPGGCGDKPDDPEEGPKSEDRSCRLLWATPNRLSVAGFANRPFTPTPGRRRECGGVKFPTGGVGMRIDAGRATRIKLTKATTTLVSGVILYADSGTPIVAAGSKVLIELFPSNKTFEEVVGPDGSFQHKINKGDNDDDDDDDDDDCKCRCDCGCCDCKCGGGGHHHGGGHGGHDHKEKSVQVHFLGAYGAAASMTKKVPLT